jgi:hypothetical protein
MRLVAALLVLLLHACTAEPGSAAGSAEQVKAVHAGCIDAMLRSTCRVLNKKSELPS